MPKLEDLKRWARGESAKDLPERPITISASSHTDGAGNLQALNLSIKQGGSAFRNAHYRISLDGKDAGLGFGKHKGFKLSEIYATDPGYLVWMLGEDFPAELKDVIEHIRSEARKRRKELRKLGKDIARAGKLLPGVYVTAATPFKAEDLMAGTIIAGDGPPIPVTDLKYVDDVAEITYEKVDLVDLDGVVDATEYASGKSEKPK
jgi:hypothetical protein